MSNHSNNDSRTSSSIMSTPKKSEAYSSQIAARLGLKTQSVNGVYEYHGPNPFEAGAENDGFILFSEGNAYDRKLGRKYTKNEVLHLAGFVPNAKDHVHTVSDKRRSQNSSSQSRPVFNWEAAIIYPYHDEGGTILYEIGRVDTPAGKEFRQRRPDGRGGYIYQLGGTRRVLYCLPKVLLANTIFVVEGEKSADRLNRALEDAGLTGVIATTAPQGAGKWQSKFGEFLTEKNVYVLPDNDEPGHKHATRVAEDCYGKAASLAIVFLPDLPAKGDVYDWLENGGTAAELINMAREAPQFERPRHFPFIEASKVLSRPDPEWLIQGLLVKGGTSLITAKHASYKSFIALDIALCVATGQDWQGHAVCQGKVLYVAAEGAGGIKARLAAWLEGHGYGQEEVPQNLFFLDIPVQITDSRQQNAFIEEVLDISPSLIILDTLARCALGVEENSAAEMGKFVNAIFAIVQATGAHVLAVHHNNKAGDYRGSSAVPAAVDTHISLERKGDSLSMTIEKQKDAEELPPSGFEKKIITLPDSRGERHSLIFKRIDDSRASAYSMSASEKKCYDALLEFGDSGITSSIWLEASAEQGVGRSTFHKAINKLEALKAVEVVGERKTRGVRYRAIPNWPQPKRKED